MAVVWAGEREKGRKGEKPCKFSLVQRYFGKKFKILSCRFFGSKLRGGVHCLGCIKLNTTPESVESKVLLLLFATSKEKGR